MAEAIDTDYDSREPKLPKWAQSLITTLRHRARRAEDELDAFRSGNFGPADTDTCVDSFLDREPLNLPKGAHVSYALGYGEEDVIRASIRYDGELEIMGFRAITVEPQASNVVVVKMKGTDS
jgi:hypothetical protein